jgi:hypothetical protein
MKFRPVTSDEIQNGDDSIRAVQRAHSKFGFRQALKAFGSG